MQRHQSYFTQKACDREPCQFQFVLTNRLLSVPRLARRSEIEMWFTIYHERLEFVMVDFTSNVVRENNSVVHVQEDFCKDRGVGCEYFFLDPHRRNVTPTWNGAVQVGQFAKEEQKQAGWEINIDCMTALRGWRDIIELSPFIWKRTRPDRVSSRLRSMADSNAEAAQPLPA